MLASANPYLGFGLDSDPVAWTALAAALVALAVASSKRWVAWIAETPARPAVAGLALAAGALSAGYVAYYLRGGPRIIDAAYYFLEGRALARGHFSFPLPEPMAAFHGRFLVASPEGGGLGVLFPPGYPAALALAFKLGAPLWLGPLLAAALVPATHRLALELGADGRTALVAAGLSVVSAALRYHTADTMSHGFAALLVTVATLGALRHSKRSALVAGIALGWLVATRPVTGLVVGLVLLGFVGVARQSPWRGALLLLGLAPGLSLLLAQQLAVTGHLFRSTQLAYYGVADGPPGCFRYGFGAGVGCLFEHGDYVRARLPRGYGIGEALATTWRRLLVHSLDVANAAPLALGVPLGAWLGRREPGTRVVTLVVGAVLLGYAPFYFEGSFPGGGARFFADVLPLEHVLLARALSALAAARLAWPLALAGFALHTGVQHRALRDREGGRPMFEPEALRRQGVDRGLLFVSTDHAFALAHQPGQLSAHTGLVVARERRDALDERLWSTLGRPPSYRYTFDPRAPQAIPRLVRWAPAARPELPRIEAESLWPPRSVGGGWVEPVHVGEPCASGGRGLKLHPEGVRMKVVMAWPRTAQPTYLRLGSVGFPPELTVAWTDQASSPQRVPVTWLEQSPGCWRSSPIGPVGTIGGSGLGVEGTAGVIDYVEESAGQLRERR